MATTGERKPTAAPAKAEQRAATVTFADGATVDVVNYEVDGRGAMRLWTSREESTLRALHEIVKLEPKS